MPTSQNYKLAKVSAPRKEQPDLFDDRTDDPPGEIIARAILRNPFVLAGDSKLWAIFNAQTLEEDIIEGDFARAGSVEWPHIDGQILTEETLSANPYCHFFYNKSTQIAAFQSTRMNKSLPAMLAGWDECLKPYVSGYGRFPYSQPLYDSKAFLAALHEATRIYSITFDMIPPNGYTNQRVRSTLAYIAEATEARDIAIKIDGGKGGGINPAATVVRELSEECSAGNGSATAPIIDAQGNQRTVSTRSAPIVKQLGERSRSAVQKLLRWAGVKVDQ